MLNSVLSIANLQKFLVHGLLKVCPNQLLVLFLAFRGLACKSRLNVYICGSSKLFIVVYERGNSSKLRAL
jgi:hypothetical protein